MKCRDCRFLSETKIFVDGDYPAVRCTLGEFDKDSKSGAEVWYSYGQSQINRGPIKRHGDSCTKGEPKVNKTEPEGYTGKVILNGNRLTITGRLAEEINIVAAKLNVKPQDLVISAMKEHLGVK